MRSPLSHRCAICHSRVEINIFACCLLLFVQTEVDIEGMEFTPGEVDSVDSISDGEEEDEEEEEDHYGVQSSSSDTSYTAAHSHRLQPHHC